MADKKSKKKNPAAHQAARPAALPPSPFVIENVRPAVDGGRYPVKREAGETLAVTATVFKEGHDAVVVLLKYREKYGDKTWRETEMTCVNPGLDVWQGKFLLEKNTRYEYTVEAYTDFYRSWLKDTLKKFDAGQDVASELLEGRHFLETEQKRLPKSDYLERVLAGLKSARNQGDQLKIFSEDRLLEFTKTCSERTDASVLEPPLEVIADRVQARFAAWYEMFPRSQGKTAGKSGTFKDAEARLKDIQAMGFDVLYLPPIHPIGVSHRKGPNNSLKAGPDDPGSPWAIGNAHGGHFAVEPGLGTLADFEKFEKACRAHGIEIALDFAINCSPDHPYVKEHEEWFFKRPDGSIKYAENPPKKYEDIYPLNFYAADGHWRPLWEEMKKILDFWIGKGVRIFRVDNPHTKPVFFWKWLIEDIQREHPDVLFLAEAFTRPPMMKMLAKAGFSQSYTYFTWRQFKQELTDYHTELTQSEMKDYFRGNLFANTPDILPLILQEGGRPAFKSRFVLAATLSSVYGIYSGFELCENKALPGKEEYADSEKYEFKARDWDKPGNIKDLIAKVNRIRRENPALQHYKNLRFYRTDNDNVLFYGKATDDKKNVVLVAVNLDPYRAQETTLHIPIAEFGIKPDETYQLQNLLAGDRLLCKGDKIIVRLDPKDEPAHIYQLNRWMKREQDFDYFGM
ncbi:MAG TPA: alpha-1,4-glucan--maltose-1-phosphate maltosyltransferase [Elusimicrobiota bacterium]|nr:alpha-1,4-glucan--maltose-1-phosphate maltosyltransferase [Elusimicrobiota bacterium]